MRQSVHQSIDIFIVFCLPNADNQITCFGGHKHSSGALFVLFMNLPQLYTAMFYERIN